MESYQELLRILNGVEKGYQEEIGSPFPGEFSDMTELKDDYNLLSRSSSGNWNLKTEGKKILLKVRDYDTKFKSMHVFNESLDIANEIFENAAEYREDREKSKDKAIKNRRNVSIKIPKSILIQSEGEWRCKENLESVGIKSEEINKILDQLIKDHYLEKHGDYRYFLFPPLYNRLGTPVSRPYIKEKKAWNFLDTSNLRPIIIEKNDPMEEEKNPGKWKWLAELSGFFIGAFSKSSGILP